MDTVPPHAHDGNIPTKTCTGTCGRTLPVTPEYFHKDSRRTDGLITRCKQCVSQSKKEYHSRPEVREHKKEYFDAYYYNPEKQEQMRTQRQEYYSRPEVIAHKRVRDNAYHRRPEVLARRRDQQKTPDARAKRRAYLNRPEVNERYRSLHRGYYSTHRVQRSVSRKAHYQDNRERIIAEVRAYRSRPEAQARIRLYNTRPDIQQRYRLHAHNRASRKKSVAGTYTPSQIQEQLRRQRYRCYYAACGYAKFAKRNGQYVYHVDHTFPLSRIAGTDIPGNEMGYLVLACPHCNVSKNNKFPWEWAEGGRLL